MIGRSLSSGDYDAGESDGEDLDAVCGPEFILHTGYQDGHYDEINGVLQLTPGDRGRDGDYRVCDITPQFFVARTDALRTIGGWDPDLKTEEHEELFVRLQRSGARVLYCPTVECLHWSEISSSGT